MCYKKKLMRSSQHRQWYDALRPHRFARPGRHVRGDNNSFARKAVLPLLAAAMLAGAPGAHAGPAFDAQALNRLFDGSSVGGSAAGAPVLGANAQAHLSEDQRRTLDALNAALPASARAWPGYDFLGKPFLAVLKDGSAVLVGHTSPPPNFRPVNYKGRLVYVAANGPDIGFSFKLDYEFSGQKITAVQADSNSDASNLVRLAIHERFHDYQHGSPFKTHTGSYRVEDGEDLALAALENRALSDWLRTGAPDAMRDFAAVRVRRRALFPGTGAENGQENLEGTARYVEQEVYSAMESPAKSRDELVNALERPLKIDHLEKGRLYPVGAALGRFLQQQTPGAWQADVAAGRGLSDLVLSRLALGQPEADSRLVRLTSGSDYARLLAEGRLSVAALQKRRQAALQRFNAQPGRRILLNDSRESGYFSSNGWLTYPDGSMLFDPVSKYIGEGFELKGIMILSTSTSLEFFLPPGGRMEIDGAAWTPGSGPRSFSRILVTGTGVKIESGPGTLGDGGPALVIDISDPSPSPAAVSAGCGDCVAP